MFPNNLNEILNQWVQKDIHIPNAHGFRPVPSPIVPGQFIVVVERRVNARFVHNELLVGLKRNFHTAGVGMDPEVVNPGGDAYMLKKFLDHFDEEFIQKVFDAESALIEKINPNGFF